MRLLMATVVAFFWGISSSFALSVGERVTMETFTAIDNPKELITDYSIESVGAFLTELNFPWQRQIVDGIPGIVAQILNANMFFLPQDCDVDVELGCSSLQIAVIFDRQGLPVQTIHDLNRDGGFAIIGMGRKRGFFVRRDELELAGVPRQNLAASIFALRVYVDTVMNAFSLALDNPPGEATAAATGLKESGEGPVISTDEGVDGKKSIRVLKPIDLDEFMDTLSEHPDIINKVKPL